MLNESVFFLCLHCNTQHIAPCTSILVSQTSKIITLFSASLVLSCMRASKHMDFSKQKRTEKKSSSFNVNDSIEIIFNLLKWKACVCDSMQTYLTERQCKSAFNSKYLTWIQGQMFSVQGVCQPENSLPKCAWVAWAKQ